MIIPPVIGLVTSIIILGLLLPPDYKALAMIPLIPFIIAVVWLTHLVMKTSRIQIWMPD
jgi:hypothetical protein